jgi:hypothetical protein
METTESSYARTKKLHKKNCSSKIRPNQISGRHLFKIKRTSHSIKYSKFPNKIKELRDFAEYDW